MALAPAGPVVRKCKQHSSCQCVSLTRLAIRSTPSPAWEKAFIVAFCQAAKLHCRINAPNYAPVARRCNRRRAGEARPKGKSRKRTEESSLSSGRFRLFPAAGRPGPPSHSTQSAFTAKHRFFVSFLTQERNVPLPPFPIQQQPHASSLRHAAVFLQETLS